MEPKQRKLRNNLLMSGTALIAVVVLDAIKLVLYWLLDPVLRETLDNLLATDNSAGWTLAIIIGATVLEVIIGCFIGLSARAEAKGKKRNLFYVILSIIMVVWLVVSTIFTLIEVFSTEITAYSVFDAVVSTALTIVVIYALIDVSICSLKNRKLNKENENADINKTNTNEEVVA